MPDDETVDTSVEEVALEEADLSTTTRDDGDAAASPGTSDKPDDAGDALGADAPSAEPATPNAAAPSAPAQDPAPLADTDPIIEPSGPVQTMRLHESGTMAGAKVDRAHRDIEVRIISPGFGASKYKGTPVYYTEAALQEAAPLFRGRKCFLNHQTAQERAARPERNIKDWAATMRESWWDADAQEERGIMRAYDPWLISRAEVAPDEIALSIDAHGPVRLGTVNGKKAAIVESISHVGSVDIVTYAGARGGVVKLLESEDGTPAVFSEAEQKDVDMELLESMSKDEIVAARPDLFPVEDTGARLRALAPYAERVQALERELNMRDTRTLVDSALAACGLPAAAEERVRAQFSEATCGPVDYATYASDVDLIEAVSTVAQDELSYIKSVTEQSKPASAPAAKIITGMGPSETAKPATALTRLSEAGARLDKLAGLGSTEGNTAAPATATLQTKLNALAGLN